MVDLRLPNARVRLRGEVPPPVVDALAGLTDPRLHLDPSAPTFTVEVARVDDLWTVGVDDSTSVVAGSQRVGPSEADLLDALVGRLNRWSFEPDPGRLHLHAAAVELDGVGLLLAGPRGSGKTTLTVGLLARGAAYLTDESLAVSPGSATVFAYPKPLTLKEGSLRHFAADAGHPASGLPAAANGRAHLAPTSLGPVCPFTRIGVVVAVRHSDVDPPDLEPIGTADAAVRLLSDSLDGARMGPSALDTLAAVLAGASAWQLVYNDAADAAELLAEIRPPLRHQLVVPHRLVVPGRSPEPGTDLSGDPYRSGDTSVRVVRFEDGAALHDGATGSLLVLDQDLVVAIDDPTGAHDAAFADLADTLGAPPHLVRPVDAHEVRAFGLPGRPVGGFEHASPISHIDVTAATTGRCTGVVVDQLGRGRPAVDDGTGAAARRAHQAGQSTCLLLERELGWIIDLLERADAAPVLLKGPVSAHDGAVPAWLRDFGDLDLLVAPDRIDAARNALLDAGFRRLFDPISDDFDRRFAKSVTLSRPFSGDWPDGPPSFELDLHRALTPGPFGATVPLEELHDRAVPVRIHGRWYRALHPEHRFLHAALHVALGSAEPRLHSVRDLVTSAPRTPFGAEAAAATAQRWRVVSVVRRALALAEATIPASFPPELTAAVDQARAGRFERLALASYHRQGRSYSLPAVATVLALRGWSDRRDYITAHLRHRRSRRAPLGGGSPDRLQQPG